MDMQELKIEELEAVSGGGVGDAVLRWAVGKALDAAAAYVSSNAKGGADETTWTNVGNSQMTA